VYSTTDERQEGVTKDECRCGLRIVEIWLANFGAVMGPKEFIVFSWLTALL
jgi:hypothetical protein